MPEKKETFLAIFYANKKAIATFPGVKHLELRYDEAEPFVFSTFSIWNSVNDLQAYRDSELFMGIWKQVKPLFAAPTSTKTIDLDTGKEIDV